MDLPRRGIKQGREFPQPIPYTDYSAIEIQIEIAIEIDPDSDPDSDGGFVYVNPARGRVLSAIRPRRAPAIRAFALGGGALRVRPWPPPGRGRERPRSLILFSGA